MDIFVSVSVNVNHTDCRTSSLLVWFVFINPTNNSRDSSFYQLQQFPRVYFGWLTVMIRCMKTACAWECLSACLSVISSSVRVLKQKSLCAWVTLRQLGFYQPPKCNKFNVRLTEFRWQSVPKPWTGDSEAPVTQPGVRPKYNTFVDVSWPKPTTTTVGDQLTDTAPWVHGFETCRWARLIWTCRAVHLITRVLGLYRYSERLSAAIFWLRSEWSKFWWDETSGLHVTVASYTSCMLD